MTNRLLSAKRAARLYLLAIVVVGSGMPPIAAQQTATDARAAARIQRDSAALEVERARRAVARAETERDSIDRAADSAARSTPPRLSAAAADAVLWVLTALVWLGCWFWLSRPAVLHALGAWHGVRIGLVWLVAVAWLPVTLWMTSGLALTSFAVWGSTIILTWKWTAARQRAQAARPSD